MKNSNVAYRYYDYYNPPNSIKIAFSDKIRAGFFRDVLSYGVHLITEDLNIPEYDNIEDTSYGFWIFNGNDQDFKVTWQFEGNKPYSLKIGYYEDDNPLDIKVLYDFTTYEEALDFIQNYMSDILTNGVPQEPEVEYDEDAVAQLKLMHSVMQSMNNENAYYTWIMTGVPDGATEEDFIDIVSDSDEFSDCKDLFDRLFKRYIKDGLYKPTMKQLDYTNQTCERLGISKSDVLAFRNQTFP